MSGLLGAALVAAAPVNAETRLGMQRVSGDGFDLHGVEITLDHSAEPPRLALRIDKADVAGTQIAAIEWRCELARESGAPRCAGPLSWQGGARGSLRLTQEAGWTLRWRGEGRRVDAGVDAALKAVHVSWQQLPLDALDRWVSAFLPEGVSITGGTLSGEARGDLGRADWQVESGFEAVALDSLDGLTAAAGVAGKASLRWRGEGVPSVRTRAEFSSGELLYQQWYVPLLPGSELSATLRSVEGTWALDGPVLFTDPEQAELRLHLLPAGAAAGPAWRLEARLPNLADSGPRYLDGPLASLGFGGAGFAGGLRAEVAGEGDALQRLGIEASDLTFADPAGVLVLSGLQGGWHWQREGEAATSALAWQALSVQGIALGPAELAGRARQGVFEASAPLVFAPFAGRLQLFPLRVHPLEASAEFHAELADIRLAALSAQLGWPEFEGRVSGTLPAVSYRDQVLASEGMLRIGVFDGEVTVGQLRWERPFGTSPSLSAEIGFDDLDLQPLTGAFGFGEITGRLDGYVRGLRMLDGSPVAFDALLRTDDDWKGKRRISQRAVNNIGSVGGGGAAAGLQATVLKLFDTFGYRRIGVRCRLANNVCEMGGVEDLDNGYVLIEGAGLPRVTVNGYRRRVDWPVLLARLEAAASGGGISVD